MLNRFWLSNSRRLCLIILLSVFVYSISFTQTTSKFPKEVKVNWDTKIFEDSIPIDQGFILSVYSDHALPTTFVLMRYIERGTFYYYKQPITQISQLVNTPIASITKQTITNTTTGGATTTQSATEYNGDPTKLAPNTRKYRVSPLRANFYYALLDGTDYKTGEDSKTPKTDGLKTQKEKGAIANTYLSYYDFSRRRVTAIIGVAYSNAKTKVVRPYLGLRYNFSPINNNYQSRYYDEMHHEGNNIFRKMSIDLGVTLASIEDTTRGQYNLFGSNNLLTGLGYRISDGFFISTGALWYNKKEDILERTSALKINAAWYFSLSFDWDLGRSLDALKKSLGAL